MRMLILIIQELNLLMKALMIAIGMELLKVTQIISNKLLIR